MIVTHICILGKFVCRDIVDREDHLNVVLLCLLEKSCDLLRARGIEEGVADLCQQF